MLNSRSKVARQHYLHSVNPLLKIGACLIIITLSLLLQKIEALTLLASVLLISTLAWGRVSIRILAYSAVTLLLFFGFSTWLRDLPTSLLSTLRLIVILLPAPLLAGTTAPMDLVRALQTIKLPGFLILSLMLIWRFLPLIQQEAQRVLEANQLRGVNLTRQPRYWFSGLLMPLIFRIVAYADDVSIGLETRGYDPTATRSISQPLMWRLPDTLFVFNVLIILTLVGCVEWRL